jgi:hypothetical protein
MAEDPRTRPLAPAQDRRVFVVEVWCEAGGFRAAARDVAQEQAHCFDEPTGLAAYLSAGVGEAAAGAPSPR